MKRKELGTREDLEDFIEHQVHVYIIRMEAYYGLPPADKTSRTYCEAIEPPRGSIFSPASEEELSKTPVFTKILFKREVFRVENKRIYLWRRES